jgi:hypothetical protein
MKKKNNNTALKVLLSVFTVVLIIVAFLYANKNPEIRKTITLATTHQPETFTELYFENPNSLPVKVEPGEKYSFAFTIHNLENKDMAYPYIVYAVSGNQKIIFDQNTVNIKKDGYQTISETVGPFTDARTDIVTDLTNKNQNIGYWLEK